MHCARRLAVAVAAGSLAFVSGCPREHGPDRVEVALEDCVSCHIDEFETAANPQHTDRLPDTCAICHTTGAWAPSTFTHGQLFNSCVTCHEYEYENTADPRHPGRFPQTCDHCHRTDAWRPALEGEHPEAAFRISGGPHGGIACVDCHNADLGPSADGVNADCTGCHSGKHARAKMDEKHNNVGDYAWSETTNFCLACHPDGRN